MPRIIDAAWFPNKRQAEKYAREKVGKDKKKQVRIYPAGDYRGAGWNVRIEEEWNDDMRVEETQNRNRTC